MDIRVIGEGNRGVYAASNRRGRERYELDELQGDADVNNNAKGKKIYSRHKHTQHDTHHQNNVRAAVLIKHLNIMKVRLRNTERDETRKGTKDVKYSGISIPHTSASAFPV